MVTTSSGAPDPFARMDEIPDDDRGRSGQVHGLRRELLSVSAEPSVNFIHVLLPHHPYDLTPWGVTSSDTWVPRERPSPGEPDYERYFAELYAMQAMQIAVVDQVIGEMIEHLRAAGAWDTGTLVVTSDHGVLTTPPHFSRVVTEESQDELLRIPLFIRAPGLVPGEVRDDPATTLDVLPSLIDLLDIETDWEMEGHSLLDGSEAGYERLLTSDIDDMLDFVAERQAFLPEGSGWTRMLGTGENGDLVGTRINDYAIGEASELAWTFGGADALADPATTGGVVPVLMLGEVHGPGVDPPDDLVVALDDVISGTLGGWVADGDGWTFSGLLGPEVEGGAREIVAYEVGRDGGTITLHPLVP